MKNIDEMNGQELIDLSESLGSYTNETFEESEKRFRENGDDKTADKFHRMTNRWFELEN